MAKGKTQLKQVRISSDLFDEILSRYTDYVKLTDDIHQYYNGYRNKLDIYYDGKEYLICQEYLVEHVDKNSCWRQVIYRRDLGLEKQTKVNSVCGTYAWNYIMKLLKKYLSETEIDKRLHMYEAEYNANKAQIHFSYGDVVDDRNKIFKHKNCYKYDINGAHNDALREIFPEAANEFERLYLERKTNPTYKSLNNFFVGNLCRKGYRNTYNWIVQRTTKQLEDAMRYTSGKLIYANTDGFIVSNPKRLLDTQSNVLGKFKLEYSGDVYTYIGENYLVTQTNELKGNLPLSLRDKVDLSIGKVVSFNRTPVRNKDNDIMTYTQTNIVEKVVKIHED